MRIVFLLFLFSVGSIASAVDLLPAFETVDIEGTTTHYNGTISSSPTTLPASATTVISELIFKCPYQTPTTRTCEISFDGGTTYFVLGVGEFIGWTPKGRLTQVKIKSNNSGTTYYMLMNRESY